VHPESHEFWPAILNQDRRALDLHEMQFQPWHAQALRAGRPTTRLHRATWILERVYHNHSHWLTAHLPKLLLLQERDALGDVVLPPPSHRTAVMDSSLRMLGIDPGQCQTFDPEQLLEVDELTVAATDRFRPELLQPVREAVCVFSRAPHRKVYISRAKASRRHLDNRNEIWPLLQEAGFERVFMEDLPFDDQVALMQEASVVMAPHGAGLTNMMFCAPGTHVIEIADLGFPNPNFYALAAAMEHNYWIVPAEGVGDGHPLERDMRVSPSAIGSVLSRLPQ
jgi:capsular polysaccharide biosynthesis protein